MKLLYLISGILLVLSGGCHRATVRGPEGKSLTLTVPRSVTIHRGQTTPVEVSLGHKNTSEAVRVSISQLPDGVKADNSSMTVETDAATFILIANETADLVSNQAVMVTVEGPDGMQVAEKFNLTVKQ